MPGNSSPSPARLHLLDVARYFAFCAIVVFHWTYALWAPSGWTEIPLTGPWIAPLEIPARALAPSGFAVLFFSFFLIGHRANPEEKIFRLAKILPLFTLLWFVAVAPINDGWDIYTFLLVAIAGAWLSARVNLNPLFMAALAAAGLSIPFWKWESIMPANHFVRSALTGVCQSGHTTAEWPLLPWIFYPTWALALGRWAYPRKDILRSMSRFEFFLWGLTGAAIFPFLSAYYSTPLGDAFGCYVFRRPIPEFWAAQWAIILVVRLALLDSVNRRLAKSRFVQWISESVVSRRFFAVYVIHLPLLAIMAHIVRRLGWTYQPWILVAGFVMIGVITEIFRGARWRKVSASSSIT